MSGENVYDIKDKQYIPNLFLKDKRLYDVEKYIKKQLLEDNQKKLKNLNIPMTSISSIDELTLKITELLEGHKYE